MTEALVSVPSVSPDTSAENRCADLIAQLIAEESGVSPQRWPTPDGRATVAAYLPGSEPGGRLVVLLTHFDTVGVEEYAALGESALAFAPQRLREVLLARQDSLPDEVRADLNEVDAAGQPVWMFGRGALDMKSGVAASIAVLSECSRQPERRESLLLLACPDEENASAGVLAAVHRLRQLQEQHRYREVLVLTPDYISPTPEHPDGPAIYTGTVGKCLVTALLQGVPTHVGHPFDGIDAALWAGLLADEVGCREELADTWTDGSESARTVPPVVLKLRDLKPGYNVQTAHQAVLDLNVLTYQAAPGQVLEQVRAAALRAWERYLARMPAAQREYWSRTGPLIKLWGEVSEGASRCEVSAGADPREATLAAMQERLRQLGEDGPVCLLGLSPPYYPHQSPAPAALRERLRAVASAEGLELSVLPFYRYISDQSYLTLDEAGSAGLAGFYRQCPLPRAAYPLPVEDMGALRATLVSIGPYGKGAHGLYERVHLPWSCEVLPRVLARLVAG